jgi:hypothetical protein
MAPLTPGQLRAAYRLPGAAPRTQTVAVIVGYDAPTLSSDLAVFSARLGLPACNESDGCLRKLNELGQPAPLPGADPGWAAEATLDAETVHGICTNCRIMLVEADASGGFAPRAVDLARAVDTAVAAGATEVVNSYTIGGEELGPLYDFSSAYDHPGVAVVAAAGDTGFGRLLVPGAYPGVVAVGATTLRTAANGSYGQESAWSGSGSGCSQVFAAPRWQTADPRWSHTGCGQHRGMVDVAADGDPSASPAWFYDSTPFYGDQGTLQSGWLAGGGTSLATPIIAAAYALAGGVPRGIEAASLLYAHQHDVPATLHDVRSGRNGSCDNLSICAAGPGYDGPTGVGTPLGVGAFRILTCRVPRLQQQRLSRARELLRTAHCGAPLVKLARSPRCVAGRVLSQGARAGASLPAGARVRLVVGRGGKSGRCTAIARAAVRRR